MVCQRDRRRRRHQQGQGQGSTTRLGVTRGGPPHDTGERLLREHQAVAEQGYRVPAPFHCWKDHSDDEDDYNDSTDGDGGAAGYPNYMYKVTVRYKVV